MIVNNSNFFDLNESTITSYSTVPGEPDDLEIRVDKRHRDSFYSLNQFSQMSDEDEKNENSRKIKKNS